MLELIDQALAEDRGEADLTTEAVVEPGATARARIQQKAPGVLSGVKVAEKVFERVDPELRWHAHAEDGEWSEGGLVAELAGSAASILAGERVALNFLGRLSGIATLTARYVEAVAGTGVTILDTRKTTPGLRYLEKFAVRMGGGENHRFALWDMYLVKDNHIRAAGGLTAAIDRIQRTRQDVPLEVEVESLTQLKEALRPEVDRILVDNRPVEEVRHAVEAVDRWYAEHPPEARTIRKGARRWPEVEVSGGITLENVRSYAETGADYISVGALTHSAPALNLSLEIEEVG
jgi:nicotinate-nucleotide pyrophosphorylase (carboxylating)